MSEKTVKIQSVLATHNAGKLAELQSALGGLGWELSGLAGHGLPAPDETGTTFEANALLKARAANDATGLWALADDSGLEVAALDGRPGVWTADFGGWEKLLEVMQDVEDGARQARFICVLALVRSGEEPLYFKGACDGVITRAGIGDGGFGYDPVFVPHGETRTFAQMDKAEKAAFSHRGKAVAALLEWAETHARNDR